MSDEVSRSEPPEINANAALAGIEEEGWFGVMQQGGESVPPLEHTVGFQETLDHPEMIVFGLQFELSHELLWTAFHAIRQGRSLRERGEYEGLLDGVRCAIRPVHPAWHRECLHTALWHRAHVRQPGTLEVVQIVWPDRRGRFPWESGFDQTYIDHQWSLQEPPAAD